MTALQAHKLHSLEGKAAVFVRGFMDYVTDHALDTQDEGLPMRKAQEAGQAAVITQGEEISIPYISKLSVLLQEAKVIYKERRGKKFMLFPGDEYHTFADFIVEKGFGLSMTKELPLEQVKARSAFLDHMADHGAVRIRSSEPLNKSAYMVAIDKFKAGEYDMVFIRKDLDMEVLDYGPTITDWTSDLFMESTHASVSDQ